MVSIINPHRASRRSLIPLKKELAPRINTLSSSSLDYNKCCNYTIEYLRRSESAWLLFVRPTDTLNSKQQVVIKILCDYKDARYSLKTVEERQKCQLEALQWNRKFTSDVYIGLVPIYTLDLPKIVIGEYIEYPKGELPLRDAEYALIMRQLPMDRRLDYLLNKGNKGHVQQYVRLLNKRLMQLHTSLEELSLEESEEWASFDQLREKLDHNLALANPLFTRNRSSSSNLSRPPHNIPQNSNFRSHNQLLHTLNEVQAVLLKVFEQTRYKGYFEQRIKKRQIKRCHGDLKAPNILIAPYTASCDKEPEKHVWIIDAIDFNPSYCNIDVLSDVAMLIIDIQVRTNSAEMADAMKEEYLQLTKQNDEISKAVLEYYLVEKAYVCAAISMVYDNLRGLGWAYLDVAKKRVKDLKSRIEDYMPIPR